MVEEVEVIDGIKIFEFSSEIKLFRHTFADEFARRDDRPFVGFEEDDLYCSNQIFQKFTHWHSKQLLPKKSANVSVRKRKSNVTVEAGPPPKRKSDSSAVTNVVSETEIASKTCNVPWKRKSNVTVQAEPPPKRKTDSSPVICVESETEIASKTCSVSIPKPKPQIVETIILDDDSDNDSIAASVDSGTETMRATPDEPPIIEIEDSDSESVDSAISVSSPLSLFSTPVSPFPPKYLEPAKKITDRQSICSRPPADPPVKPLSDTLIPARAHVITVEPTSNCDKPLDKNLVKTIQNRNAIKQWSVQKKMAPPSRHQEKKSPILKEYITNRNEKKNQENVDNNNKVVPALKTTSGYSLACLSPGVGYIPLLEFGINKIKFEDPFGSGKVKMYANVMHATKWLNSEVQARLNFEACTELKWTVVNAVIVQAKRLSRFDFQVLSQPNCRITKNGVIFS